MAKKFIGTVTSDLRDKTITVQVTRRETHPVYGKQYTVSQKFQAHDEANTAKIGDRVEISETRPVSKTKTWKLDRVVEASQGQIELRDDAAPTTSQAAGAGTGEEA